VSAHDQPSPTAICAKPVQSGDEHAPASVASGASSVALASDIPPSIGKLASTPSTRTHRARPSPIGTHAEPSGQLGPTVHTFTHERPTHASGAGQPPPATLQSGSSTSAHEPAPFASITHVAPRGQSRCATHADRQRPSRHTSGALHESSRVQLAPTAAADWQAVSKRAIATTTRTYAP
jgi:hypothetical protein